MSSLVSTGNCNWVTTADWCVHTADATVASQLDSFVASASAVCIASNCVRKFNIAVTKPNIHMHNLLEVVMSEIEPAMRLIYLYRYRDRDSQDGGDRRSWSPMTSSWSPMTSSTSQRRGSFLYRATSTTAVCHGSESPTSLSGLSRNSSFTGAADSASPLQLSQQ